MDKHRAAQIRELFEVQCGPLQLYARTWLGADAASEVVQEAFVRLMTSRFPQDPVPWLFRVVRNLAISRLRFTRVADRIFRTRRAASPDFATDPSSSLSAVEAQEAMSTLTPAQREIVVLHLYAGLTFQAAAAIAGTNPTSAFRTYRDALAQLKAALEAKCPTSKTT